MAAGSCHKLELKRWDVELKLGILNISSICLVKNTFQTSGPSK